MEKTNFKKMLFDIACSAVACDGHIDEREIEELKRIAKSTTYFKDINLSKKLEIFVEGFKNNPDSTIEKILNKLKASILNPVEEMLILEIVLRLIYADVRIDENEITFLQSIRSRLSIDDELLTERFGEIEFLIRKHENVSTIAENEKKYIDNSIDVKNLENMYFNIDNNTKDDNEAQ
tara:strand:- start:709 stop:1242 length:534 start_codon:yes stop_codon:yes gene_type:complete